MDLFVLVLIFALCLNDEIEASALWRERHLLLHRCCKGRGCSDAYVEVFLRFGFPGLVLGCGLVGEILHGVFCSETIGILFLLLFLNQSISML